MIKMRRWSWILSLAGLLTAGCGDGGADDRGPTSTVVVDGSSTVLRISKAAQEAFREVDPAVRVVVDNHGTGGGFSRYLQGEVDIVDASRDAQPDEQEKAKAEGIEWVRFLVGYDGITLVVNPENTFAKSLTVEQLRAIWSPGSKLKTWRDVDPAWPDRPIILYSPDNDSGTFEYFTEKVVGQPKSQRDDVQQSSDDNTLVSGVAGDVGGLGYFGYAYYAANKDKLRSLAVQNGPAAKAVDPSPETIADKSYAPLSRPLYIFVKKSSARRAEVGRFLAFYLENIDKLAVTGGYNPPTDADKTANAARLAEARGAAGASPAAEPTRKGP